MRGEQQWSQARFGEVYGHLTDEEKAPYYALYVCHLFQFWNSKEIPVVNRQLLQNQCEFSPLLTALELAIEHKYWIQYQPMTLHELCHPAYGRFKDGEILTDEKVSPLEVVFRNDAWDSLKRVDVLMKCSAMCRMSESCTPMRELGNVLGMLSMQAAQQGAMHCAVGLWKNAETHSYISKLIPDTNPKNWRMKTDVVMYLMAIVRNASTFQPAITEDHGFFLADVIQTKFPLSALSVAPPRPREVENIKHVAGKMKKFHMALYPLTSKSAKPTEMFQTGLELQKFLESKASVRDTQSFLVTTLHSCEILLLAVSLEYPTSPSCWSFSSHRLSEVLREALATAYQHPIGLPTHQALTPLVLLNKLTKRLLTARFRCDFRPFKWTRATILKSSSRPEIQEPLAELLRIWLVYNYIPVNDDQRAYDEFFTDVDLFLECEHFPEDAAMAQSIAIFASLIPHTSRARLALSAPWLHQKGCTLKQLCRRTIYSVIPRGCVPWTVNQLYIPECLKSYLLLYTDVLIYDKLVE